MVLSDGIRSWPLYIDSSFPSITGFRWGVRAGTKPTGSCQNQTWDMDKNAYGLLQDIPDCQGGYCEFFIYFICQLYVPWRTSAFVVHFERFRKWNLLLNIYCRTGWASPVVLEQGDEHGRPKKARWGRESSEYVCRLSFDSWDAKLKSQGRTEMIYDLWHWPWLMFGQSKFRYVGAAVCPWNLLDFFSARNNWISVNSYI